MAAISTRVQSRAGLVAMGATVIGLDNVTPLGVQSYTYKGYFDALVNSNPQALTFPCLVAKFSFDKHASFQTNSQMGGSPQDKYTLVHILLHSFVSGTADYTLIEPDMVTMHDHYNQALAAFSAGGGWSVVSHSGVDMTDQLEAVKLTLEGREYNAIVFEYGCVLNL